MKTEHSIPIGNRSNGANAIGSERLAGGVEAITLMNYLIVGAF